MNNEEIRRLTELRNAYEYSQCICDPIDFAQRQKELLQVTVRILLEPLYEYEKSKRLSNENKEN